jgi:hypothetical protein
MESGEIPVWNFKFSTVGITPLKAVARPPSDARWKFARKQEEAIAALLSHRSIEDAAQAIHVAPRTMLRWLQVPEFRDAYLKARREAVGQSIARMQQLDDQDIEQSRRGHFRPRLRWGTIRSVFSSDG